MSSATSELCCCTSVACRPIAQSRLWKANMWVVGRDKRIPRCKLPFVYTRTRSIKRTSTVRKRGSAQSTIASLWCGNACLRPLPSHLHPTRWCATKYFEIPGIPTSAFLLRIGGLCYCLFIILSRNSFTAFGCSLCMSRSPRTTSTPSSSVWQTHRTDCMSAVRGLDRCDWQRTPPRECSRQLFHSS